MSATRFRLNEDAKFEFLLDEVGRTTAVVMSYRDGRPEVKVEKQDGK